MALMTREQAEDTRQRMVIVAQSMLETDAGRAELVKLATEINALADQARAKAQFAARELSGKQPPADQPVGEQRRAAEIYIPGGDDVDSSTDMVFTP